MVFYGPVFPEQRRSKRQESNRSIFVKTRRDDQGRGTERLQGGVEEAGSFTFAQGNVVKKFFLGRESGPVRRWLSETMDPREADDFSYFAISIRMSFQSIHGAHISREVSILILRAFSTSDTRLWTCCQRISRTTSTILHSEDLER